MGSKNSIVNLGDLSKPATVLIEKISNLIGGVFKPYQIKRIAKAEVEAEKIRTLADIEIRDLQQRALIRFVTEETKKQANIESIVYKSINNLEDDAKPEGIEDDWIMNFFDKCKLISDNEMQKIWAKILAGEANSPGAFSRKTINMLADLDKGDAELFMRLCSFGWVIGDIVPLVYDCQDEFYHRHGINFNALSHLESLGFIRFDEVGFDRLGFPKKVTVYYNGRPVELTFPKDAGNILGLGEALLTRAGHELAPVCGSEPVDGFFDFVYDRWASKSLVSKRETGQDAPADADKPRR